MAHAGEKLRFGAIRLLGLGERSVALAAAGDQRVVAVAELLVHHLELLLRLAQRIGARLELGAGVHRLPVQARVVDGAGGVAGEILGHGDVPRAVASPRLGRDQRQRSEHPVARDERHAHVRANADRAEQRQVLRVLRAGDEQLVRHLLHEVGLSRAEHPREPSGGVRIGRVAFLELARQLDFPGIEVRDGEATDRSGILENVHCAPVAERRHGELGERAERRFVVER